MEGDTRFMAGNVSDGNADLILDPLSQFGSFAYENVSLARLGQLALALAGQCHKRLVLAVDLHLTSTDRTLFSQCLLRRRQTGLDFLDVGGWNESLAIVHLNLPPILFQSIATNGLVHSIHYCEAGLIQSSSTSRESSTRSIAIIRLIHYQLFSIQLQMKMTLSWIFMTVKWRLKWPCCWSWAAWGHLLYASTLHAVTSPCSRRAPWRIPYQIHPIPATLAKNITRHLNLIFKHVNMANGFAAIISTNKWE